MTPSRNETKATLKKLELGTPSWGYADSGTRFHVFRRPYTPRCLEERLEDAAQVQRLTGICPYFDLHTALDRDADWASVRRLAESLGLKIGAVNPHLYADDDYVLGSVCNPNETVRRKSLVALLEGVEIARMVGAEVMSMWFADGTNAPGQDDFRLRHVRLVSALETVYKAMTPDMRMVLEYKFFEPGFYHMDIADWGTAYMIADKLGDRARLLIDMGHHPLGVNIEQIVALLLLQDKLGGFHFNDKKYGDDDLTVGSIQPYQLFLVCCELVAAERSSDLAPRVRRVALMIDQNHNVQNQIEGTIQSALAIQSAFAKALSVDYDALEQARTEGDVVMAEEIVKSAFEEDVRPLLRETRIEMGLDPDPLQAFRRSGYETRMAAQRAS
jgi:L-rhamnose isomerase / sugar isomerase